jgi:exosome complex exonuclease DIS3/RRP44
VRFELDSETHDPLDVKAYETKDTNALVEEFMLFANINVAQQITDTFPQYALLRRHPPPDRRAFDSLLAAAKAVGVELKVDTSKQLADSLDAAVKEDNPFFNKLLRILATRCMQQVSCWIEQRRL